MPVDQMLMFSLHYLGISADTDPPVVSACPADQPITVPVGTTTNIFTWTPPTATDAAGIQSIVSDHQSGVVVSVGNPIIVTYTVTDNNGLTNTDCSFALSVGQEADTDPPVVSACPSDETITVPVDTTTKSFTWTPPTATDAAGIQSIVSDHQSGVEVSVDNPITVTYTVTDNNGLTNTDCSFTLSVLPADLNWKCSSTKCYHLATGERSWQEAKNLCTNMGLVTTATGEKDPSLLFNDNDPDFEKIENLFSLSTKVWINCSDSANEGTLICDVDGTGSLHTAAQENWNNDEPSGGNQHDCVAVGLQSEKWENSMCNENYHTVCQVLL
ncbi:hyalin-like [Strongylocentrotus purpuratus]|uniref:Egg receptor for bindin n=1 Tax=Strongylocentrotus purpuratus TaxID=7668 RepID=A0A7M7NXM1_STRPU|nr:hyalin-like [Strongylocentrotus purpuratus]